MLIPPEVYQQITSVGCLVAAFLNLVVVPLTVTKSKYSLGSFKIIMLVFSTTNMLHYFVDTFSLPRFYTSYKLSIVYVSGRAKDWGEFWATFFGIWLCNIFMLQVFIEALHFLYRYVLLCREGMQFLLTPRSITLILFVSIPTYVLIHTANFVFMMPFDSDVYGALANDTSYNLDVAPTQLHGIAMLYSKRTSEGEEVTRWSSILGVAFLLGCNATVMMVMVLSGLKIHKRINGFKSTLSKKTKEMQQTLFVMLIAQTVIPLVLLHTPCAILLIGPFFFSFRSGADLMMLTILIYPLLEPLVVVYFLNRQYLLRLWRAIKSAHNQPASVTPLSAYSEGV